MRMVIERVAGADGHPPLHGAVLDIHGLNALGHGGPEEHTALGLGILHACGEILLHALVHLLGLGLIKHPGLFDVLVQVVVGQVLGQDHLAENVGVQVHGGLIGQELFPDRGLLAGDPADAHTRGDSITHCSPRNQWKLWPA